jgi:1-deoxy-D-xylulose-5-phosphate reductoisomerase
MKRLAVLGSTGSIGTSVSRVVARFPDRFAVTALAARGNVELLARQIGLHAPRIAVVADEARAKRLAALLPDSKTEILHGPEGYAQAASLPDVDMVVSAMVGAAGLLPTLAALSAKKTVALANKETLVMAGALVTETARKNGVSILPVDSEHSAIFQCLQGQDRSALARLVLTASGGPFRILEKEALANATPGDALRHPNWTMGKKITIDSATLMNKGLEVIEARWLFDVPVDNIGVVVHPESVIHSMAVFHDGAVLAQMGVPDMLVPIAFALSWPDRLPLAQLVPDLASMGKLTFEEPDTERFPCLKLAYQAAREGGAYPAVLNAANEEAVGAFLDRSLSFPGIAEAVEDALSAFPAPGKLELEDILAADAWARARVARRVDGEV